MLQKRNKTLYDSLKELGEQYALELAAAPHRPEGWLPRTVFIEEDEYENGYTPYMLMQIHPDGTCDVRRKTSLTQDAEKVNLTDINIDWLMTLLDLYASLCHEQGLEDGVRRCSHCGRPMKEGYYLAGEYACSDGCCLALYNGDTSLMKENLGKADTDEGECYYTEWDSFAND